MLKFGAATKKFAKIRVITVGALDIHLQKSDRKISHQNDLPVAVKEYTVNSLYPFCPIDCRLEVV